MKKVITLLMLIIAVLLTLLWQQHRSNHASNDDHGTNANTHEKQVLYWYDPMVPQQHFDKPGKSPFMEMELVPKYAEDSTHFSALQIDHQLQQNLAIRFADVTLSDTRAEIVTHATVVANERDVVIEQARSAGVVDSVPALAPGDVITAGGLIATLKVPEWTAAQQEWLLLQQTADQSWRDAAWQRLQQLGIPTDELAELKKLRQAKTLFTVRARRTGVITSLDIRAGMSVNRGQTLIQIVALDPIWLDITIPEPRARHIHVGDQVRAQFAALGDECIAGNVAQLLPQLNQSNRTVRARVVLRNRDQRLRAGMSAQVTIATSAATHRVITIPTEAILYSGKRTLVFVVDDERHFTPTLVSVGDEIGDRSEILRGLSQGQRIVSSGQFLLDSEANLSGLLAQLDDAKRDIENDDENSSEAQP